MFYVFYELMTYMNALVCCVNPELDINYGVYDEQIMKSQI